MDLLSSVLNVLKLSGTLYFRTAFREPWGVEVPSFERVCRFHYVHRGRCFARVGNETLALNQGDLVLITRGASHVLSDPSDVTALSLDDVVEASGFDGTGALVFGGDPSDEPDDTSQAGHRTELICGHFAFEPDAQHVLIEALPAYVHVREYGQAAPDWLQNTLNIISNEVKQGGLGSDLIAHQISEVIFAQVVRHYLQGEGQDRPGLAAFSDPSIRRALEAMHDQPAQAWTLDGLARTAGLSRTVFVARFSQLVCDTPHNYLTGWRMQLARQMLVETELPIIDVAERVGYQSEASFGRVFKRAFDVPPATYRRARTERRTLNG